MLLKGGKIRQAILAACMAAALIFAAPNRAYALCCGGLDGCMCSKMAHRILQGSFSGINDATRTYIENMLLQRYRDWFVGDYFNGYIRPALYNLTQNLTVVGMAEVMAIGQMLDAKEQLETMRLLQKMTAQAYTDYHPSAELCTFGTAARGLASAERNAQMTATIMTRLSMDRQLGNVNTRASSSSALDRQSRLRTFKERYCDPRDNNNGLASVCLVTSPEWGEDRIDRDVDFTRTVGLARTLDVDFADNVQTNHETDVIAMSEYLYANNVPARLTEATLKKKANQDDYLDWRSIVAKRGVAQNSFNTIVGMKSSGNADFNNNTRYVAAVLAQLGMPQAEAEKFIAPGDQPSYYALMEVLGQKIYQDDAFYTNLYDTPANIARKDVAMQAIGLMVDRDSYRSELRYESMLSVLLEMELMKYQRAVQNTLTPLEGGKP